MGQCVAKLIAREATMVWRRRNIPADNMTVMVIFPAVSRVRRCRACFRRPRSESEQAASQLQDSPPVPASCIPSTAQLPLPYVFHHVARCDDDVFSELRMTLYQRLLSPFRSRACGCGMGRPRVCLGPALAPWHRSQT